MHIPGDAQEDSINEPPPTRLPLTAAQAGVWFAQQLAPTNPQFNTAECIELVGAVDVPSLVSAVTESVRETEVLAARFRESPAGGGEQSFGHPTEHTLQVDLSAAEEPWQAAEQWMKRDTREVVDLTVQPPVRTAVLTLGAQWTLVYIRAHHVALDAFGFGMLTKRISQRYTALTREIAAPPARFGSIAAVLDEESVYQASGARIEDAAFWSDYLAGAPEATSLARGANGIAFGAHSHRITLDRNCFTGLKAAASSASVMWTDVLTAAVAAYLHAITGARDLTVAYPVMNRLGTASVDVPITAVNVLPLRLTPGPAVRVFEFAAQVRASASRFRTHTAYRGEDVARDLRLPSGSRGVMGPSVNVKPFGDRLTFGEVRARVHSVARGPLQDFMVTVRPLDDTGELEMWVDADAEAYAPEDVRAHAARLEQTIRTFASGENLRLGSIRPVLPAEKTDLVRAPAVSAAPVSGRTVVTALIEQAEATPDAPAVVSRCGETTFGEFVEQVLRIAGAVDAAGIGPGDRVALLLPRETSTLAAFFAVMATGAAYVPIDPDGPTHRVADILTESGAALVLTSAGRRHAIDTAPVLTIDDAITHPPAAVRTIPDNRAIAYVIFTSGSTGRPKGVEISHRGLIALFDSHRTHIHARVRAHTGHDRLRVGHAWTFAFDASWQPQLWLLGGHCVDLVDEDVYRDTEQLAARVASGGWDFVELSPAQLEQILDVHHLPHKSLPAVGFGGDAVTPKLWSLLRERNRVEGSIAFNFYGPTECTVDASFADVDLAPDPEIGSPVYGSTMYVLGIGLQPLPTETDGELYVRGPGVAQGYVADPARTATRFVADPFGDGERMYRSGDVARWTSRHTVVHAGRADDQVKVRGFRIELAEVENALASLPGVESAVASVHGGPGAGARLIGYVVADRESATQRIDPDTVRHELSGRLPDYMIPAAILTLDTMPLTANGKIDRRALPVPTFDHSVGYRSPRTELESQLCQEFSEVLGVDPVGIEDDFFVLGGHSLSASRLVAKLRTTIGWDGTLRQMFDHPTVSALAQLVAGRTEQFSAPVLASARPAELPLSYAQQRLWFQFRLDGPGSVFNVPIVLRLPGPIDVPSLRAALGDGMERHESLRTVFPETGGTARQLILDVGSIPMFVEEVHEDLTESRLREHARYAFDLATERPIRVHVLRSGRSCAILLLVHHIASDEVSTPILLRDWAKAFELRLADATPTLADATPELQYADYALWQRAMLGEADDPDSPMSKQIQFWRDRLHGVRAETALATDRPRPARSSGSGSVVEREVPPHVASTARSVAAANGASPFMFVHAALAWMLGRSGEGDDVVIGTPTAGRPAPEFEDLVGFFVNTVTLRTDVSGDPTVEQLLARVRECDLDAYAHQDVPFDRVALALAPERHAARHPLFQILLQFRALPTTMPFAGSVPEISVVDTGASQFDLTFDIVDRGTSGWTIRVEYSTDLYDSSTVDRLAERLLLVIEQFGAGPTLPVSRIPVATSHEQALIALGSTGRSTTAAESSSLVEVLTERVRSTPDALAVVGTDGRLSFSQLFERSQSLAAELNDSGVGPEVVVALRLPRTTDMVVGIVAVWLARGAYLVVEPTHPRERVDHLLADSAAGVMVTTRKLSTESQWPIRTVLVDTPRARARVSTATPLPESAAYVVYTSGSTGTPKGVVVPHRGLLALLRSQQHDLLPPPEAAGRKDVLGAYSFAFDSSVEQVVSMVGGHTLHVLASDIMADSRAITEYVRRERIDVVDCVPLLMKALLADGLADGPHVPGLLAVGGEAVGADLWEALGSIEGVSSRNVYGPSECTVDTTIATISGARPHLGRPIDGTRLTVLDDRLRLVPVAVAGELYVSGPGITRGYLGRFDSTAARFVADPDSPTGGRMYRTGDMVRWNSDGSLEYLGRSDNQVKIRGFRVETGEIEAALHRHPEVRAAVVVPRTDDRGNKHLVGYVSGVVDGTDSVSTWLRTVLPDYMVPPILVALESLPVTANGKIDRGALPVPDAAVSTIGRAAETDVERSLCAVFSRVLGGIGVGPEDDFFALGGDSIVSIQVVSAARAEGISLTARDVFEQRTVAALAGVVGLISASEPRETDWGTGDVPLTPIMRDMFDRGGSFARFAQSRLLVTPIELDAATAERLWRTLLGRHPMLRARLADDHGSLIVPSTEAADAVELVEHVRVQSTPTEELVARFAEAAYDDLDPTSGRMVRVVFFDPSDGTPGRMLVALHHLVVDGVSWRILVGDLAACWEATSTGAEFDSTPTGTSFRTWAHGLIAAVPGRAGELPTWIGNTGASSGGPTPVVDTARIATGSPSHRNTIRDAESISVETDSAIAQSILTEAPETLGGTISDIMVTALALAVADRHGNGRGHGALVRLDVEGHGREESTVADADLSSAVGWFTSLYPMAVDLRSIDPSAAVPGSSALTRAVKIVKDGRLSLRDNGIGYGMLRHLDPKSSAILASAPPVDIGFNYLGRLTLGEHTGAAWSAAPESRSLSGAVDEDMPVSHALEIGAVTEDRDGVSIIGARFGYVPSLVPEHVATDLAQSWVRFLGYLAEHAHLGGTTIGLTPAELTAGGIDQDEIDEFELDF